jgi:hypothetical protein
MCTAYKENVMKLCIRPFGIGVEDVDTAVLAEKGKVVVDKVSEKVLWTGLVAIGLGLIVGEVLINKTADTLFNTAESLYFTGNKLVDVRDQVIIPAKNRNADKRILHSWALTGVKPGEELI